jgi:inward rectifier potassium channel
MTLHPKGCGTIHYATTYIQNSMLNLKKIYSPFKEYKDTGFGASDRQQGTRFMDKNGRFKVIRSGLPWWDRWNVYAWMLELSWLKFYAVILSAFIAINLIFTGLYFIVGIDHLIGLMAEDNFERFFEVFFFSVQTFSTVGYGRVNPLNMPAGMLASTEVFIGLLTVAIATGLVFAKFSRPIANLLFSKNILLTTTKDGRKALLFRFVNKAENQITDVGVQVLVAMDLSENGESEWKFYNLPLERDKINFLALSWTVVHYIDENSPLFNLSQEDIKEAGTEILILITLFDDTFAQTVHVRHSYKYDEWKWNATFRPMFKPSAKYKDFTELALDKINDIESQSEK